MAHPNATCQVSSGLKRLVVNSFASKHGYQPLPGCAVLPMHCAISNVIVGLCLQRKRAGGGVAQAGASLLG